MFKKIFQKIFGCGETELEHSSALSKQLKDLENFVDYVVKSLVDAPEAVRITTAESDDGAVISIHCKKEDIGKIVGKRGKTIIAIRSLVSGAAGRMQQKVTVEVVD